MWLEKLFDGKLHQVYGIREASKEFKDKYNAKFILIYCGENETVVDLTNEVSIEDLVSTDGCLYVFTYSSNISKKLLADFETASESIKLPVQRTFSACLDRHYVDNPKITSVFELYPTTSQVCPLFSSPFIIRAPVKKLKLNELSEQLTDIANELLEAKANECKGLTVEEWLVNFIQQPFKTYLNTCVIYPKEIRDSNVNKAKKIKANNITVAYDVRASNYKEEVKLFAAVGEAFEKPNKHVTIFDSYNGILKKIKKKLDKAELPYKQLNDFSISVQYQHLKEIDMKYDLTDFL